LQVNLKEYKLLVCGVIFFAIENIYGSLHRKGINITSKKMNSFYTNYLFHGAEPFLKSRQLCSYSRTSQHFMDCEGLLTCSQEPFTGPYPGPD
jgi:hypothetical protein